MKLFQVLLIQLILLTSLFFALSQPFAESKLPIIDMHLHALKIQDFPGPEGKAPPLLSFPGGFTDRYSASDTDEKVMRNTIAEMNKYNIVLGFLSGNTEDVYKWVAAAPDRFIPSPSIDGSKPDIDFLRAELSQGRIKALGEITAQYYGKAPDDPILEPYFKLAEEFDVPVLIHTAGIGAPIKTFRSSLGNPILLEEVLVKHPKLRLWVENAGFPFLDDMIALMYQYPQIYADLSTISWIIPRALFHDYLKSLIRAGLGKRLMFGSDQVVWPEAIGMAIESVETADFLTEEQKRDIFYHNAARFLRLDSK
jgi:uncharacterized protein